ncbi:MAG: hypothetical protein ACLT1J_14090 [Mediterraneibacter gnavus]
MIAAAVILVFSGMHLMKKAYNQQQVPRGRKYAGGGSGAETTGDTNRERTGSAEGRQQWPDSALEKRY